MFKASAAVERGFCRDCGTPLFFRYVDRDRISVSLGSLDEPARVVPANQFGVESRLAFVATLTGLPGTRTEDDVRRAGYARGSRAGSIRTWERVRRGECGCQTLSALPGLIPVHHAV